MGQRGPAPKPTALRVLHGDKQSRINHEEPMPREGRPEPPAWMRKDARAHFDEVVDEMSAMHLATPADVHAIALYSNTLAEYVQASRRLARGVLVKGRDGGLVKNPAAQIVRDHLQMLLRFEREFGLTPSARSGLRVQRAPISSPVDSLLS
jgi:P27 family predicted phage terminase small subunit